MSRTVTVRGTGRLRLKPDLTVVELNVTMKDKDYSAAMARSAKLLESLRAGFKPLGFRAEDLKTSSFNVNTEYDSVREDGVFRNVFSGYRIDHRLSVTFPFDTERLSAVLGAISASPAAPEVSIRFTVKDRDALVDGLLKQAAVSARERAEVLAEASGVRLGTLAEIRYEGREQEFFSPTVLNRNNNGFALKAAGVDMEMAAPEDISVTESAVFVWEIE